MKMKMEIFIVMHLQILKDIKNHGIRAWKECMLKLLMAYMDFVNIENLRILRWNKICRKNLQKQI